MTEPAKETILALHGITMSAASMRHTLGPLGDGLRGAGFELVVPEAGHVMTSEQFQAGLAWVRAEYRKHGQDADETFRDGMFWDGNHRDWFDAGTDAKTGQKVYRALSASLETIRTAVDGHRVVGVLGFSQGCAMAYLATAYALAGTLPFGETLRFGIYLSGFKPEFDAPALPRAPVAPVRAFVLTGTDDPIFPDADRVHAFAGAFDVVETHIVPGLGHVIPTDPHWVDRIVAFASA